MGLLVAPALFLDLAVQVEMQVHLEILMVAQVERLISLFQQEMVELAEKVAGERAEEYF